ncbi:hypothetical protein ACIPEN_05525 [Herbaspirillum chlorophenolicum]|uniref:Lipoprotein n=1 Tax=Herbaspirillum chlorophenolicum TaxID=211589 RepID=A0ABW8EYE2_9BURK
MLLLVVTAGCSIQKPLQPPPHPAEQWSKSGYWFSDVLGELRGCGWMPPAENIAMYGKINMDTYAQVERCMQEKGFVYTGRTPLICSQKPYITLSACVDSGLSKEHGSR